MPCDANLLELKAEAALWSQGCELYLKNLPPELAFGIIVWRIVDFRVRGCLLGLGVGIVWGVIPTSLNLG